MKLLYPKYKLYRFSNKRWGSNKVYRDYSYIYFAKLKEAN
tara:strand:- start:223 stop:342 length:120 start_codon:yes stop_codon:yes gene_type:complete